MNIKGITIHQALWIITVIWMRVKTYSEKSCIDSADTFIEAYKERFKDG